MQNYSINQITAEEAKRLLIDPEILFLDVRSEEEYNSGHLETAKLIPVDTLALRHSEIASHKLKRIVVYCHSGSRSAMACQELIKAGFTQLLNLQGGILSWVSSGFNVVK
jgi:rhodanese-related sulfurtransferase